MKTNAPGHVPQTGFTLVECATVCGMVGVLVAAALPSFQGHRLRIARLDAVDALTRVQAAQEQHFARHGLYATELSALQGVSATSLQGRYRLALQSTGTEAYRATAIAAGAQRDDSDCRAVTLDVTSGFVTNGPHAACWNR